MVTNYECIRNTKVRNMGISNPDTARHDVAPTQENQEQQQEAADAGYSSAEQARAATELAKMWQAHKTIDTALAGRAKAMLKEVMGSGGDIDIDAIRGLLDEAKVQYEEADAEVVKAEGTLDGAPDETTFFKVEPKEAGSELPLASDDDVTETTAKVVKPVAQKFVPPPLPTLVPREASGSDMFAGPAPSEHAPRIVADTSSQEKGPVSVEKEKLMQQRQEVANMVDVNIVKLRRTDRLSDKQVQDLKQNQKDAYALLAKIDEKLKAA